MSNEQNLSGNTLIVDSVQETGSASRAKSGYIERRVNAVILQKQTNNLQAQIAIITDDGIITATEKNTLKALWGNIQTQYALGSSRATEYGIDGQTVYLDFENAFVALSTALTPVFFDMTTDYTIPDGTDLDALFTVYYNTATTLDNTLFQYQTGLLDGLDDRVNTTLILSSSEGTSFKKASTTLSVKVERDGVDITDDVEINLTDADFKWSRLEENWSREGETGKSITISDTDLVSGSGTFVCNFTHYYDATLFWSATESIILVMSLDLQIEHNTTENKVIISGANSENVLGNAIIKYNRKTYLVYPNEISAVIDRECYIALVPAYTSGEDTINTKIVYPFAEQVNNDNLITWKDFTDDTGATTVDDIICLLGRVTPTVTEVFPYGEATQTKLEANFMSILANANDTNIYSDANLNVWAKAMGIDKLIESLAVVKLFADKIMANDLTIYNLLHSNGSTKETTSGLEDYMSSGFELKENGMASFMDLFIRKIHLNCQDSQDKTLIETQYYQEGTGSYSQNVSPTRWSVDDFADNLLETKYSGLYNGVSCNVQKFISDYEILLGGANFLSCDNFCLGYQGTIKLFLDPAGGDIEFYVNDILMISTNIYDNFYLELNETDNIRFESYNSLGGGLIDIYGQKGLYCFQDTNEEYTENPSRFKKILNNFKFNYFYENHVINANGYTNDKIYRSITDFANSLPSGLTECERTTERMSQLTYNGTAYTIVSVYKTNSQITFTTTSSSLPSITIYYPSTTDEFGLNYYDLIGTIYPLGKSTALLLGHVEPADSTTEFGSDENRIKRIYIDDTRCNTVIANELHGEVYFS